MRNKLPTWHFAHLMTLGAAQLCPRHVLQTAARTAAAVTAAAAAGAVSVADSTSRATKRRPTASCSSVSCGTSEEAAQAALADGAVAPPPPKPHVAEPQQTSRTPGRRATDAAMARHATSISAQRRVSGSAAVIILSSTSPVKRLRSSSHCRWAPARAATPSSTSWRRAHQNSSAAAKLREAPGPVSKPKRASSACMTPLRPMLSDMPWRRRCTAAASAAKLPGIMRVAGGGAAPSPVLP